MGGRWDVEQYDHLTEEELEEYREMLDRYLREHEEGVDNADIRNTQTNGETLKNGDTHRTTD